MHTKHKTRQSKRRSDQHEKTSVDCIKRKDVRRIQTVTVSESFSRIRISLKKRPDTKECFSWLKSLQFDRSLSRQDYTHYSWDVNRWNFLKLQLRNNNELNEGLEKLTGRTPYELDEVMKGKWFLLTEHSAGKIFSIDSKILPISFNKSLSFQHSIVLLFSFNGSEWISSIDNHFQGLWGGGCETVAITEFFK